MSGSMMSNVGNSQIYEANEQRPDPQDNEEKERFHSGKRNIHDQFDSKDVRPLANKAAASHAMEREKDEEAASKTITDPLAPARANGNEPSHGAKVDAELQAADEEELRRKGKA